MELEQLTRKTKRRPSRRTSRRRSSGLGGCFKAMFRSIMIHSGCLSSEERHDDILISSHHPGRRRADSGCDDSNININIDYSNSNSSSSPNQNYCHSSCSRHHHQHHHHHHSGRNVHRNDNDNNDNGNHGDNGNSSSNSNGKARSERPPRHHGAKEGVFTPGGIEEKPGTHGVNNRYTGAMFSLQNCTLHCEVCRNGETYWASFTERSFYRGRRFKLYRGVINGQGPQSGEKCVVKVFLQKPGTEDLCKAEVRKSDKLRQLTRGFNQRTRRFQDRIRCPPTYWAQVDEVSKLKQLFFTGERKLRIGESVLFEPDIRIADDRPGKLRKVCSFMDGRGKHRGQHVYPVLDAFVHYTYHGSDGELVACGFEGVVDEEGFSLITPIIHSKSKSFGEGDQGEAGMANVFRNHVCNSLCRDLNAPSIAATNLRVSGGPVMTVTTEAVEEKGGELEEGEGEVDEDVDLGESSSMRHFPQRSSSVDEGDPLQSDQCSKASECATESMGGYLEPSAPDISECLHDELLVPPPAYTRERAEQVSHWLIQEDASNSLLQMYTHGHAHPPSFHFVPHHPGRSLSVISQTAMITPFGGGGGVDDSFMVRRSSDVNANFHNNNNNNPAVLARMPASAHVHHHRHQHLRHAFSTCETVRSEETMETRSTNSAGSTCDYSLSSAGGSGPWTTTPSEGAASSTARSDAAMETGSSSCSSSSTPSLSSARGVDNALYQQDRQGGLLVFQAASDFNRNTLGTTNTTTSPAGFFEERPPSYEESEEATRRRFNQENTTAPPGTVINDTSSRNRSCDVTTLNIHRAQSVAHNAWANDSSSIR